MDYKVLITDSALADLREIVEFVSQDDPHAAARLGEKLIVRALSLSTLPKRHPLHDATRGIRKMPLAPYLVFYTLDNAAAVVNILHFWHGARRSLEFTERRD
ncbi:MAG: type II toxin-antitoxin system RelE/ParE family toxin [Verrucomicrobiales bacterium]